MNWLLTLMGPLLKPLAGLVLNWLVGKVEGDKADAEVKKLVLEFIDKLQEKGVIKSIELSDAVLNLVDEMKKDNPKGGAK